MAIRPTFNAADIDRFIEDKFEKIDAAILSRLRFIGEHFVQNARENGQYRDITGNLRNSIGYIILKNGLQVDSDFKKSAVTIKTLKSGKNKGSDVLTSGSKDGLTKGKALAEELAKKYNTGYVLIVVAGMEYAAAVESRGKDVLTASSIIAKNDLRKAFDSLKNKIGRMR